jgi:hypothetical protein
MQPWAVMAVAAGCLAATPAAAQSAKPLLANPVSGRSQALSLRAAAFAPVTSTSDDLSRFIVRDSYVAGEGPVAWTGNSVRLRSGRAAVDTLRVSVGGVLRTPGGSPLNIRRAVLVGGDYEVSVTRNWPAAVRVGAGPFDLDVSPHAGFGMSTYGGLAEAGATLRMAPSRDDEAVERLRDMGVGDGARFGDTGRWYLFMAASGRAVGLNMLRRDGGWDRAGWTTDPSSTLTSNAQLGVGWRKGAVQGSLGYVHREVKGEHMVFGQETRKDSLLALTLSIKPGE